MNDAFPYGSPYATTAPTNPGGRIHAPALIPSQPRAEKEEEEKEPDVRERDRSSFVPGEPPLPADPRHSSRPVPYMLLRSDMCNYFPVSPS